MGNLSIDSSTLLDIYTKYEPAVGNLFKVQVIDNASIDDIASLHATKVSFNGESINLLRNNATKNFQLSKNSPYKRTETLTITWRETKNWDVKRFHEDWISLFYDRKNDQFKSVNNSEDLYKTFRIILPKNSPGNYGIEFKKVFPKDIGNIDLEWSNTPKLITHTLSYYVTDWRWFNE